MLNVVMLSVTNKPFLLSVFMLNVIMVNVFMLSVFMLSIVMLCVFMLSVIMLNVVAPKIHQNFLLPSSSSQSSPFQMYRLCFQ